MMLHMEKITLLFLVLLNVCNSISVVPLSEGRVSASHDHNLVLLKDGWRKLDKAAQFKHGLPPPPIDDKHKRPDSTIVVLIASLRETRLKDTLVSLFTQAKYPNRITIAVVQQNANEDLDIVEEYCDAMGTPVEFNSITKEIKPKGDKSCPYVYQIRVMRMLDTDARGPAYARALGNQLVDFEKDDFCMQIDAHTKVVKDWDVLILEDWGKAENEFAILTTYPTNIHDLGKNTGGHWEMPHLCCAEGRKGVLTNCQAKAAANLDAPLLAPLWAAGLSFSKCHAEKVAPNDPNLKGVFAGEEYGRGVRLWTHGYDFYSNSRPWIGTYYGGEKGSKSFHWKTEDIDKAHARLATLVKYPESDQSPEAIEKLGKYGLGTKRTLEQYIEFSGIDPWYGKSTPKCAGVYVPWYVPSDTNPPISQQKKESGASSSTSVLRKVIIGEQVPVAEENLDTWTRLRVVILILSFVILLLALGIFTFRVRICRKTKSKM